MAENPPVLVRLKHETQRYHDAVEARVSIEQRLASPAAYRALLARFWGFYVPLERALGEHRWPQPDFDFAARRKVPRLAADLRSLGVADAALAELPLCAELPALPSLPHAVGALYVVEGATLGGQLIARLVEARLGLTGERGAAFFGSYGSGVGAMWRAFRSFAGRVAADDLAIATAVAAATATFQVFDQWLACEEIAYVQPC